jgi:tryptophan synthase alpha chain
MSRLSAAFNKGRPALATFVTGGDPTPGDTGAILDALVEGGADIIELGMPFTDPMADGPAIQLANLRSLGAGTRTADLLAIATAFRERHPEVPLVLMGYANPIEAFGVDAFCSAALASGVDGVLVVDYPPEEANEFALKLSAVGLDPIFLLAPTSVESRYRDVARIGSGYLYYVALKGVTGAGHLDVAEVAARIPKIRAQVGMPVGVGFGIRDAATARQIAAIADDATAEAAEAVIAAADRLYALLTGLIR